MHPLPWLALTCTTALSFPFTLVLLFYLPPCSAKLSHSVHNIYPFPQNVAYRLAILGRMLGNGLQAADVIGSEVMQVSPDGSR